MIRTENRLGLGLPMLALTCSLLASPVAEAASKEEAKVADLEKKLDASMKLIAQLTARLDQLEKSKADQASVEKASAASADSAAKARCRQRGVGRRRCPLAAVESGLVQMSDAANRSNSLAGVPVHGFMDVRYAQSQQKVEDGRRSGFMLGNVDFYLTPQFSDRVRSLIELNLNMAAMAASGWISSVCSWATPSTMMSRCGPPLPHALRLLEYRLPPRRPDPDLDHASAHGGV